MRKRTISLKKRSKVRRERDPIPWRYCLLTLACGLILVGGFFTAASLHFSSIDYGIKNSNLRREVKKLKTEKRRLILRRELALSGISKTARKIGFRRRTVNDIELVSMRKPVREGSKATSPIEKEKTTIAFIDSEALVKGKHVKLKGIENKITKTVKAEPGKDNKNKKKAETKRQKEKTIERTTSLAATKR